MATNNANDFNNPIAISQGGTNASSMGTVDGVAYYDGTSLVTTDAGISMQLLTSNGPGLAPTWQAGGGGAPSGEGWDFIDSQTGTAGVFQLDFTSLGSYNILKIVLAPGNNPLVGVRYSTNGGASYVSSGYDSAICMRRYTGGFAQVPFPTNSSQAMFSNRAGGSSARGTNNATAYLFNVTSGDTAVLMGEIAADGWMAFAYAALNNAAPIDAIRIVFNLASTNNTVSIYGLNES